MSKFIARAERMAQSFAAYGRKWAKDGEHLQLQMRRALMTDSANWPTWKDELKASEREQERWGQLKKRLTSAASELAHDELTLKGLRPRVNPRYEGRNAAQQALAATPEGQALISKAREEERKKLAGVKPGGKPDGKVRAGHKAAVADEDEEVNGAAQVPEAEETSRDSRCASSAG
jgi:hypothetical protein